MSLFSERLKKIMELRGITQSQLCAMTDIPKSAMTQYLSACFEPRRGRLDTISRALDVNQSWLMGFTDSMGPYGSAATELSADEERMVYACRRDPDLKKQIDALIASQERITVFRAANSEGGKVMPEKKTMSGERLKRIIEAPETDEDL